MVKMDGKNGMVKMGWLEDGKNGYFMIFYEMVYGMVYGLWAGRCILKIPDRPSRVVLGTHPRHTPSMRLVTLMDK